MYLVCFICTQREMYSGTGATVCFSIPQPLFEGAGGVLAILKHSFNETGGSHTVKCLGSGSALTVSLTLHVWHLLAVILSYPVRSPINL